MNSLVEKFYNQKKTNSSAESPRVERDLSTTTGNTFRDKFLTKYNINLSRALQNIGKDSKNIDSEDGGKEGNHTDAVEHSSKGTESNESGTSSAPKDTRNVTEENDKKSSSSNAAAADELTVLLQIIQSIYDDLMSLQQLAVVYNNSGNDTSNNNGIYDISESPENSAPSDGYRTANNMLNINKLDEAKDDKEITTDDDTNIENPLGLLDFEATYNLKDYYDISRNNSISEKKNDTMLSDKINIQTEEDNDKEKFTTYLRSLMLSFFEQIDEFSIIEANNDDTDYTASSKKKSIRFFENNGTGNGQLFDKDYSKFKTSRETQKNKQFVNTNSTSRSPKYCTLPNLYQLVDTNDKILRANELQFLKFKDLLMVNNETTLTILKNFLVVTIKLLNLKVGGVINSNSDTKRKKINQEKDKNEDEDGDQEEREYEDDEDEFDIEDCLRDVSHLEKTLTELKIEIEKNSELLMKAANETES